MEVDETSKSHIFQILSEQTNIRDLIPTKHTVKNVVSQEQHATGVDGAPMQAAYHQARHFAPSNTMVVDPDWATDDIYMDVVE